MFCPMSRRVSPAGTQQRRATHRFNVDGPSKIDSWIARCSVVSRASARMHGGLFNIHVYASASLEPITPLIDRVDRTYQRNDEFPWKVRGD